MYVYIPSMDVHLKNILIILKFEGSISKSGDGEYREGRRNL